MAGQKQINSSELGARRVESAAHQRPAGNDRGYSVHERVFSRPDIEALLDTLDRLDIPRTKAGARHLMSLPAVSALANDARLLRLAAEFVGPAPVPFRATLFDKSSDANWLVVWHQDTALPLTERVDDSEWGPWSIKAGVTYAHAPAWALERVVALRIHLDDCTADNGPLRVLPRTHTLGVLEESAIETLARTHEPGDCLADAGGVVAMRPLTVHASSKATAPRSRRVLHIEYADDLVLRPGIRLAIA